MIFAHDLSDPLTSLVKKIDAATENNSACKMGSFVVFINDDKEFEQKLKDLAEKDHLEKISLATMSSVGSLPESYKIDKEADVTVVLYTKNECKANYAFKKGELKDKDVDKIVADIKKITPEEKEKK
jgi:hypothetical protein